MNRDYVGWYRLKADIQKNRQAPDFSERDVWWCSIGANIGFEEDGKNDLFERPVLIIRKFNKELFIGIPLTSVKKGNKFYHSVTVARQVSTVILSQQRALSSKRLIRRIGRVGEDDYDAIVKKINDLIKKATPAKARVSDANGDLYSNNSKDKRKSQASITEDRKVDNNGGES